MQDSSAETSPISMPQDHIEVNPHFAVSRAEAKRMLASCAKTPFKLTRPLFIISGYHSPKITILPVASTFRRCTTNPQMLHMVSSPLAMSLESGAANAVAAIQKHAAGHSEIDIIGHSMGGVIARMILGVSGMPHVCRLFTLATPHRGAIIAPFAPIDRAARQLRCNSEFLNQLNARPMPPGTEVVCYARLYDWWVGAQNCAPPGHDAFWLDADTFVSRLLGHFTITRDERIQADIIRRMRGEAPLATIATHPPRQ